MPHNVFLQDLAVVLLICGGVTVLFHQLKQPVVLGYILAGLIIGPHTPPFALVNDEHAIETLAELGVILLMFSLGLHFSLRKLAQVGATAFVAASLEILLMSLIGYGIGRTFGWGHMNAIFLGAILSISSSTIIAKALEELGLSKKPFAELVFGILIIEDILAIAVLALLSSIAMTGSLAVGDLLMTLGRLTIFLTVVLVVGLLVVPPLLSYVARFRSNEMLLITALGLCFGVSLLATLFGYSVALGAFLIGAIIAEARESGRISTLIEPVRDMFSAIFFVAVGMLIDPHVLVQYAWPIVVITLAVVIGKVITCSIGTLLAGHDPKTSLRVGMSLAQIGEFSFIIAQLGLSLKVTGEHIYPIVVMVSALTTLFTPYLIRSSDTFVNAFDRLAPRPMVDALYTYAAWIGSSSNDDTSRRASRLIRKWCLQLALNVVLITGLFIVCAWAGQRADEWLRGVPAWIGRGRGSVWLVGMVLSLPLVIATYNKLRVMAAFIAELRVPQSRAGEHTAAIRAVLANTILIAGMLPLAFGMLALSYATLPPWRAMVLLLLIVILIGVLMWRSFVRVYAKAQIALTQTLAEKPDAHADHAETAALPPMLRDAQLETVTISEPSAARGQLIRQLQVRSATGASVVAIDRATGPLINPVPDEELEANDRVLLIGTTAQLAAAVRLLTMPRLSEENTAHE